MTNVRASIGIMALALVSTSGYETQAQRAVEEPAGASSGSSSVSTTERPSLPAGVTDWRQLSNRDWQKRLTRMQFLVTRMKGTEPAWSGQYMRGAPKGSFACVCCGEELFSSNHKFQSGTGWPSFWRPIDPRRLEQAADTSWTWQTRVEVLCARCGAHLGHVFRDGPPPTGLRYCINSVALRLVKPGAEERWTVDLGSGAGGPSYHRPGDHGRGSDEGSANDKSN